MAAKFQTGANITFTIGGKQVTLDSGDSAKSPLVYELPANDGISVAFSDIVSFVTTKIGYPGFTLPDFLSGINQSNVEVDDVLASTSGDFRLSMALTFNSGGLTIFPGFSVTQVGLRALRVADPSIMSVIPPDGRTLATLKKGDAISIGGSGLLNAKSLAAGADANSAVPLTITDKTDNFFLQAQIPADFATTGALNLYITTADGVTKIDSTAAKITITVVA